MHRAALVVAFATIATVHAQGELWVEPVLGNDGNTGTYDMPLRTLGAAVGLAGAGTQIHLLEGVYGPATNGETLPIRIGQIPQPNLVIRGIGEAVFDFGGGTTTAFYLMDGADGLRMTNLTIQNMDQAGWWTRAINSGNSNSAQPDAADDVEIDRCKFVDINRGFVLWVDDIVTGWKVHDNLFVNCANDAILEYSGTNEFFHNTFYTGAYKAYISDSATSTFTNNLIVDYAIAFENNNASAPINRYQGNWIYQCPVLQQGPGMTGQLPASNTVGTDPMLVNPTARDFHPLATSPLIDGGVTPPFARACLDNNSRLVDGDLDGVLEADIGCYERSPVHLAVNWDPVNGLMWLDGTTTIPGSFGAVTFCFKDGLTTLPGQGPILIDQGTWIQGFLVGALPQQWVLPFIGYTPPPGMRLVMQIFSIAPNHVGSAVFGGNQVWQNL